jgi:hypothetical protein
MGSVPIIEVYPFTFKSTNMKKALLLATVITIAATFNSATAQSHDSRRDPYAREESRYRGYDRDEARDREDRRREGYRNDHEWREQMERRHEMRERMERQEARRYRHWLKHHAYDRY